MKFALCCIPHKPFATNGKVFIFIAEAKVSSMWNCVTVLIFISINNHFELVNELIKEKLGINTLFQFCVYALYAISGKLCKLLVAIPHFKHFQTIFFLNGFNHAAYHNICFLIFEPLKEAVTRHIWWALFLFQGISFIVQFFQSFWKRFFIHRICEPFAA